MSWVTIIWSMIAGVCVTLAAVVWRLGGFLRTTLNHAGAPVRPNQVRFAGCKKQSAFRFGVLMVMLSFAGCKSSSPAPYVSPKVTGRVLEAETQRPIKGVKVRRLIPDQEPNVANHVKGGQVMVKAPAIRTASDGTFELASERSLAPFQRGGWYSVSLAFEHPGYLRCVTNYTLRDAHITPKGEPLVQAGDIPLRKVPQ